MYTTNSSSSSVVRLAGGNLTSAHLNPAEEEGGGMGFDRYSGKMSRTPDNKDMDPEPKLRYDNEQTTQLLEDTNLHSKSPRYTADTKSPGTPALLCPRNGIHQAPATDGTAQDISTSDVRNTVHCGPGRKGAAGNEDNTTAPKDGLEASMAKHARNVGTGTPESYMV
jgi:hypothetical protein